MTSSSLDPLCIILVKSGAHGGKLLFKYPFDSPSKVTSGHESELHCHLRGGNPYKLVISEDLLNQREYVEQTNIQHGQLHGMSDETLANLFSVSKDLCGSKFELKVNDVRFVGHPVSLEPDTGGNTEPAGCAVTSRRQTTLTMFHIVFALRADTDYSLVHCYHELSQRLGLILYHEETRVGYMTQQMKSLIAAHDEVATLPEDQQEHPFSLAVERSHLAKDIQTIFNDLCQHGEVRIYINKWVELSFCLPHKVHKRFLPNVLVEPESIFQCLESLRPYHSLLLQIDPQDLLDQLSTDSSPALRRLIRQCSPVKSFRSLAVDCDLSLMQVFQLAGHLLYWARATIIYPICESNVYIVSPHLPSPLPHKLREKFCDRFSESLVETLATFSSPRSVSVCPPLSLHQHRLTDIVIWLLRYHLISQLHTYVTLVLDDDITLDNIPAPTPGVSHHCSDMVSETVTREELLQHFSPSQQSTILSVTTDLPTLTQFARFSKYWTGEHHIEEMMYHENCSRYELLQCLDKFSSLLVKHEHEDPVITKYWSRVVT